MRKKKEEVLKLEEDRLRREVGNFLVKVNKMNCCFDVYLNFF